MLTIHLFGIAQISLDGQELQVARRKSRALVYYLAAHEQAIPRQQLLSLFWPDLPRPAALQTLRTTLYGLRQLLGSALSVESDQVSLAPGTQVDARLFESTFNRNLEETNLLAQTLALYRGEFLQGFSLPDAQDFEDWLTVTREHYRRLAVRGWTGLAAGFEAQQDYRQALDSLEQALSLNPLQEDLQRESIRLLYLAGDRPGAIRRYDDLRRLLDEEMGVPPMVETRKLYDAILTDRLAPAPSQASPPLRRAVSPPAPRLAKTTGEIPFTGRSAELASLQGLVPPYPLVLIEGEPGVGKTRLAQEYQRTLAGLSLVGRGRELEQALPYHPIIEALRDLLSQPAWPALQADLCQELPPLWLAEVARLAPELNASQSPDNALRPAEEARLWEGLRQLLTAVAQRQPLALLIDDLQWADSSTLGFLGYLARQIADAPLRLLATLRPVASRSPVITLVQALTPRKSAGSPYVEPAEPGRYPGDRAAALTGLRPAAGGLAVPEFRGQPLYPAGAVTLCSPDPGLEAGRGLEPDRHFRRAGSPANNLLADPIPPAQPLRCGAPGVGRRCCSGARVRIRGRGARCGGV